MDHTQAVATARKLSTRSEADQWELARLTYEHTTGEGGMTLTGWAQEVGISQPHATNLRKTWILFEIHKGTNNRNGRSFNECYTEAMRTRNGEQPADAQRRRDERGGERENRKRDPLDVVRELARNRKRRREVLEIPELREEMERRVEREVRERVDREVHDRVEREVRRRLEEQPRREEPALGTAAAEIAAIRTRLNLILDRLLDRNLTQAERRALLHEVKALQDSLDWTRGYVRDGDRSFEDALNALLGIAPKPEPAQKPTKRRTPPVEETSVEVETPSEREARQSRRRDPERAGPRRRAS